MAQDILSLNGTDYELGAKASNVSYSNTTSGMTATNVQDAIDELKQSVGSSTPYVGKTIAVIGDSFTAAGNWFSKMCDALGATAGKNTAKSGGAWHGQDNLSAYQQAQELATYYSGNTKPDYILVVMGVNDIDNDQSFYKFSSGVTLGSFVYTDQHDSNEISHFDLTSTPYSFTAGIQATLTYLKRNFPDAIIKIGWTPSGMQFMSNGFKYGGQKTENGSTVAVDSEATFDSYIKRLQFCAHQYGVAYIDTLSCGISYWLTEDYEAYTKYGAGEASGIDNHPSAAGHLRIAAYMARLMLGNI